MYTLRNEMPGSEQEVSESRDITTPLHVLNPCYNFIPFYVTAIWQGLYSLIYY